MKISLVQDGVTIAEFESEGDTFKDMADLWGQVVSEAEYQQGYAYDMAYEDAENESDE